MAESLTALLGKAAFSFIGTVSNLGATTMANVPTDDHTAVVQIEHVLHAPPSFVHLEGQRITVQLSASEPVPAVGQSLAFFTQGVAFGESIVVAEIGRLPVSDVEGFATAAVAKGKVAGAFDDQLAELRADALRAHAAQADAIVVGRVVSVEKAGPPSPSEHDPDWWRATVAVTHVEKGQISGDQVSFLYPNSLDVRWHKVPKAHPGMEGVLILHSTDASLEPLANYVIRDPNDHQPTQQLNVLRRSGG
jgi:hypothetical protein